MFGLKSSEKVVRCRLLIVAQRVVCFLFVYLFTVEPVYNGPVLSGHPLLSGQFLKSRLFAHPNAVFVTCIRRPLLLSGHGHPVAVLCLSFFVILTCIKRPPLNGN